jgi:histidyl-tRNA synthetase
VPELRHPTGTFDVLPPESGRWEAVLATFAQVAQSGGYGLVLTPLFEDLEIFQRLGESTDVVRKEMYDFRDKGGRHVALRPELTASVARAYIEHRPAAPWKVWSAGPSFRYERPQAGRYRQFHQLDLEALGTADPDIDVEVVALGWEFYARLGLRQVTLLLNSLGDGTCRPAYRKLLLDYLSERRSELCDEHRARFEDNPLRVLDCKRPPCQAVTDGAPRQVDHLCDQCQAHFDRVRQGLEQLRIPFRLDTRLVRGLDYYTRTTFEYAASSLRSAQNAVGGGGRYDGLIAALGGPDTPAIGFALGVERILLAMDAEHVASGGVAPADVFVVDLTGGQEALALTAELRAAGLRADRAFDNRSARAQFKAADRSGATIAVVVGPDEAAAEEVSLRQLRGEGDQVRAARDQVVAALRHRLGGEVDQ